MSRVFESLYTKVVGVTRKNKDGVSRQDILASCSVGDKLVLMRDKFNEYDENAIEVLTVNYQQLGYLNRKVAANLAPLMDSGFTLYCEIENITGGEPGKETLGCNIRIDLPKDKKAAIFSKRTKTIPDPTKVNSGCRGCLAAFIKFVLIMFIGFIVLIVVIGFIKGW